MVILDLWGISFHPAIVVGLGNDLLFNSILAHCDSMYTAIEWAIRKFLYIKATLSIGNLQTSYLFLVMNRYRYAVE
jgi:hypothetical protein